MSQSTHPTIYRMRGSSEPWGDYSSILIHGMASEFRRDDEGQAPLERTGPFVPPMTFPNSSVIVVTDDLRIELESSPFSGFSFRPVIKKKIVRLHWETWDPSAPEPAKGPSQWEPENYIDGRKHSQKTADEVGKLWELVLESHMEVEGVERVNSLPNIKLLVTTWDGTDFFWAGRAYQAFVAPAAEAWLRPRVSPWVVFDPVIES